MCPVLFITGSYEAKSYLVISLLAILLAVILIRYYEIPYLIRHKRCYEDIRIYSGEALFIAVLFTVIGARLGYVVTSWPQFAGDPSRIFQIWRGGLAFHGALVAVLLAVVLHSYIRKISLFRLLDLSIPYISFSYALGRVGCFLNGCCYGHETSLPWGFVYPAIDNLSRHPTQLYSSLTAVILALILLKIHRVSDRAGLTFGMFLIFFGVYRFVVEFLRVSESIAGPFSLAQLVSLLVAFCGVILLIHIYYKGGREENYCERA